ncbi:MAG: hypothetical protein SFY81_16915 [Verrucomicrobiota bacterium]|nr:hypothetical protein [Verrucomicrobiota bacterium]
MIAYEDNVTNSTAMRTCDHVVRQLGSDVDVKKSVWSIDVLSTPGLKIKAAEQAAEADMIIIAAHRQSPHSEQFRSWVDLWSGRRNNDSGALVALLDGQMEEENKDLSLYAYMEGAARENQMEFFGRAT